jgi:hypothetical protein
MKYLTDGRSIWRDMSMLKHRSEHPRNGQDTAKDRQEILAYVAGHPGCSRYDIELCCFQSRNAVLKHLAALQTAYSIEKRHGLYQAVGAKCEICGGKAHSPGEKTNLRDASGRYLAGHPRSWCAK